MYLVGRFTKTTSQWNTRRYNCQATSFGWNRSHLKSDFIQRTTCKSFNFSPSHLLQLVIILFHFVIDKYKDISPELLFSLKTPLKITLFDVAFRTYVFFKQPSTNSIQDIVVMAFRKELWITLIGVWAALVISIKVRLVLLSQNNNFFSFYSKRSDRKFVEESVLWSVAAFCQKSRFAGALVLFIIAFSSKIRTVRIINMLVWT